MPSKKEIADIREAESEAAGWNRLLAMYQSQEAGWGLCVSAILDEATAAWRSGNTDKADELRALYDRMKAHPKLAEIKQEQTDAYAKQVHFEEIAEKLRGEPHA